MFHVILMNNKLPKQTVELAIRNHRIVKRYFYALDKKNNWHIIFGLDSNMISKDKVFEWFKTPSLQVKCLKGRGALMREINNVIHQGIDCYGTNLDLDEKRTSVDSNTNTVKDEIEHCFYQIEHEGMSIEDFKKNNLFVFNSYSEKLNELRINYLINKMNAPELKINYFVHCIDDFSAMLIYQKLMKSFYPLYNKENVYFVVSEPNMFYGYDGQPIVIWKNITGKKLLQYFGNEKNLLAMLNNSANYRNKTIPTCNRINIFSSKQTFDEFVLDISKDKDKVINAFLLKIDGMR